MLEDFVSLPDIVEPMSTLLSTKSLLGVWKKKKEKMSSEIRFGNNCSKASLTYVAHLKQGL